MRLRQTVGIDYRRSGIRERTAAEHERLDLAQDLAQDRDLP
jgi:hypothetical protein